MAIVTIGRLSEEIKKLLDGGDPPIASNITFNEIKIAIGQVLNQLLKIDYFQVNVKMGEIIPNGTVLGFYEGIVPVSTSIGKSKATLPIKPQKLLRNMGVWSVFMEHEPEKEFIPLQMGQGNLIQSQPMINGLLGQIGYENFGMELVFTKDLPLLFPGKTISMRLAIMDVSQYGDYDILPVIPEMEWQIKQEVVKLYSGEPIPDKIVDSTNKERKQIPVNQQTQS